MVYKKRRELMKATNMLWILNFGDLGIVGWIKMQKVT